MILGLDLQEISLIESYLSSSIIRKISIDLEINLF